ncbi:MAG: MFS transporter [Roseibacillus sp.]|nr:MFS transporter [Roseibacillus sp.]
MSKPRTSPDPNLDRMPSGIPYIIGNEAAERFSFYGMKTILAVFMTKYLWLMNDTPGQAMTEAAATEKVHLFNSAVYLTPIIGGIVADAFFGKYRTIIWLSVVYCFGHAALALMGIQGDAVMWLLAGLVLISIGSGGIKSCVSAHVGDQFGASNQNLITRVFNYFYWSINLGAFLSTLLTPWLLKWYGPHLAFGIPGVLMALATLVFWLGRRKFIHVPPARSRFLKETFSKEGLRTVGKLFILFLFVAMFWSLFDQTASRWIFQAQEMDRTFLGVEWLESQIQAVNPVLILTFIPLFTFILYPRLGRVVKLTPLRKIGAGLFLMAGAFALSSTIQGWIDAGQRPSIGWQILAYGLLTAAEVLVSIVALEFSYTQAPRTMKSLVLGLFLFAVSLGNLFTAAVNRYIQVGSPSTEIMTVFEERAKSGNSISLPEGFKMGVDNDHMTYAGYDQKIGSGDDIHGVNKTSSILVKKIPGQVQLGEALNRVEQWSRENDHQLPRPDEGKNLVKGLLDPWGNPLRYFLEGSRNCRVSSDGPDGITKTRWDIGINLAVTAPEKEKVKTWHDALHPEESWLDRRKAELGMEVGQTKGDREFSYDRTVFAGGGERLEGASYYWFFTALMFLTAIIFIPYARFYRGETILQE